MPSCQVAKKKQSSEEIEFTVNYSHFERPEGSLASLTALIKCQQVNDIAAENGSMRTSLGK